MTNMGVSMAEFKTYIQSMDIDLDGVIVYLSVTLDTVLLSYLKSPYRILISPKEPVYVALFNGRTRFFVRVMSWWTFETFVSRHKVSKIEMIDPDSDYRIIHLSRMNTITDNLMLYWDEATLIDLSKPKYICVGCD